MSYELIPAIGTQCTCGEQPWLLCPERFDANLPAFYICGVCGRVGQVGGGLIIRPQKPASTVTAAPVDLAAPQPDLAQPQVNPDR